VWYRQCFTSETKRTFVRKGMRRPPPWKKTWERRESKKGEMGRDELFCVKGERDGASADCTAPGGGGGEDSAS